MHPCLILSRTANATMIPAMLCNPVFKKTDQRLRHMQNNLNLFVTPSLLLCGFPRHIRKRPKLLASGVSSSKLVTTNRALTCHMQNWKRFSHIIKR